MVRGFADPQTFQPSDPPVSNTKYQRRKYMFSARLRLLQIAATIAILMFLLSGCGSGGSSGGGSKNGVSLKVSDLLPKQSALEPARIYMGIALTLHFPPGITVKLVNGEPSIDVVKLLGAIDNTLTYTIVKYTAATATTRGSLKFMVLDINNYGFKSNGNEYIELLLDVSPGYFPTASDFTFSDFIVSFKTDSTEGVDELLPAPIVTDITLIY